MALTLSMNFIIETYQNAVKCVEHEIQNRFNQSQNELNMCSQGENAITDRIIDSAQSNYTVIVNLTESIQDDHSQYTSMPESFKFLLIRVMESMRNQLENPRVERS